MNEPIWGGHPFFQRHGVAELAEAFFSASDDIDYVVAHLPFRSDDPIRLSGQREPDMEKPEGWPEGQHWFPPIERRRSGRPFADMPGAKTLGNAILALLADVPYDPHTARWAPECWFGRTWAYIKAPFAEGSIYFDAEGRKRNPGVPFWIASTEVHFDRNDSPLVDVAADGGPIPHLMQRFRAQPEAALLRAGVEPTGRMTIPGTLHLPLDAFKGRTA